MIWQSRNMPINKWEKVHWLLYKQQMRFKEYYNSWGHRVGYDWATELNWTELINTEGFPGSSADKESICNPGDPGSIPRSGRSHGEVSNPVFWGFLGGSDGKESACNAGDLGLISGLGRSPGEGTGYPLQYSCLENSMEREAWWATVHGVTKNWIWLCK